MEHHPVSAGAEEKWPDPASGLLHARGAARAGAVFAATRGGNGVLSDPAQLSGLDAAAGEGKMRAAEPVQHPHLGHGAHPRRQAGESARKHDGGAARDAAGGVGGILGAAVGAADPGRDHDPQRHVGSGADAGQSRNL